MGNLTSVIEENSEMKKELEKFRQMLNQMEITIKKLQDENDILTKNIKRYEKLELLTTKHRPDRDEDLL